MADAPAQGYLARHGATLIANGYKILPIRKGSKAPPMDDWQKIKSTPKLLDHWLSTSYTRSGVGLLTNDTPAVDLDILDRGIALKMQAFVEENFGFAPIRVGHDPKRLLVFRCDDPFAKINSRTFEDPFGDPEASHSQSGKPTGHLRKVEILGAGQQFVAFHVHPDTGKPYQWIANGDPTTVAWADLPVLTEDDGRAIVAEFERLAEGEGWTPVTQGRAVSRLAPKPGRQIAKDDVFASDKAKVDLPPEELRKRLLLVPNAEDYDTWFQVGMSLWHQFDGEQDGLDLWHEWSSTAFNYDPAALDEKWDTFDAEGKNREPLTARFILKLAAEQAEVIAVETFRDIKAEIAAVAEISDLKAVAEKVKHIEFDVLQRTQIVGMVRDRFKALTKQTLTLTLARDMCRYEQPVSAELPHWLEGWVYIGVDKSFYNRRTHRMLSTEAFNAFYSRFMLTKTEILEGKSVPETRPSDYALNNRQIPTVSNKMYLPGEDDLFSYNRAPFVNSYNSLNVPDLPGKLNAAELAAVETVKGHFAHLFADANDRAVLLDAIAFIIQNPGKRLNWSILLQGTEGDGKTFFAGLLAAALGPENVNNLTAQALEERNNAWAEGVQVNFFEEIRLHGHNRFDVLNKVKPLITNLLVSVRRMNVDWYQVLNTATYFLTTNFRDALPLDDNDSRYFILFSRFQTKEALEEFNATDPTYYQRLYDALQHGGALRKWLLGHKIAPTFSADKRAPDSKAKREMIRYARTEEAAALREALAFSPRVDLTKQLLSIDALTEWLVEAGLDVPYGKSMAKLLLEAGFTRVGKVRIGKDTPIFWSQVPERFQDADGNVNELAVRKWCTEDL